ncbi:MAG: hypothetical protein IPJ07_04760 [Acidobacteria bacterium]|nr:hypothetical protein [Acidobacteriota bacterium]
MAWPACRRAPFRTVDSRVIAAVPSKVVLARKKNIAAPGAKAFAEARKVCRAFPTAPPRRCAIRELPLLTGPTEDILFGLSLDDTDSAAELATFGLRSAPMTVTLT